MSSTLGRSVWLSAATVLVAASPALPALFIVDTTLVDLGDIAPGDGKCEWATFIPVGQRCTLRAAIQEANALAGADVILIPAAWRVALGRPGTGEDGALTGDLDILTDVAIGSLAPPGAWPVIDGNGLDSVFDVHAPAKLTIGALEITGGQSIGQGGGIFVRAGATLEAFNCRLYGNRGSGGGLRNQGTATVERCSIHENLGRNDTEPSGAGNLGILTIIASTIWGNREANSAVRSGLATGLTVRNTTIADNLGILGNPSSGLGIESFGDVVLWNVTISGHPSTGLRIVRPGAFSSPSIRNTIIAGNGTDCSIAIPGGVADIGHPNLDSDGTCGFLPAFGGLPNSDPMLGGLGLNGGTTRTMVPRVGSPAVDSGSNVTCESVDQRGATRPLNGDVLVFDLEADCDLGAVEVLPCNTADPDVTLASVALGNGTTTACFTIKAGPAVEVQAGAAHSFRFRDRLELVNDFTVRENTLFSVFQDPAAGSSVGLP